MCTLPFSESSLSEESLLPEDEDPVFILVTFVVSRGFSTATHPQHSETINPAVSISHLNDIQLVWRQNHWKNVKETIPKDYIILFCAHMIFILRRCLNPSDANRHQICTIDGENSANLVLSSPGKVTQWNSCCCEVKNLSKSFKRNLVLSWNHRPVVSLLHRY